MSSPSNPSEIARETLTRLAVRKLVPTPENYAQAYQEIAASAAAPTQIAVVHTEQSKPVPAWPDLIRELLKQLDTAHRGIPLSRKKDGVQTVLKNYSSNGNTLFEKLQGLMKSWVAAPTVPALDASDLAVSHPKGAGTPAHATAVESIGLGAKACSELVVQLREMLAQTLEISSGSQTDLRAESKRLAEQVRFSGDHEQNHRLSEQMRQHLDKLEFRDSERTDVQEGVVRLLRLLVNNVGELSSDDGWLHGQVSVLREILSHPMDKKSIADAERSLRDTMIKQGSLKQSLVDSRTTLKNLLTTFVDCLADVTEQTGEYHSKIEGYSQRISSANNISDVSHLLDEIMLDTRAIQANALHSHAELISTRKQANDAQQRVRQLEHELELVSGKMHEDQLTGALNRRGMDEALAREISRSDRQSTPISLALLDIDNFKQLNDTLGHQAGDQSLVHLTTVIKETLRPTDTVARYGGEEFIIIMSETALQLAVESITRLQRELTKKLFLHNDARKLITFSAGVALRGSEERAEDLINRADQAMYQAKKAGKNRVVAAD